MLKPSELLHHSSHWTKGVYARDYMDTQVNPNSPHACKWCMAGAIHKCFDDNILMIRDAFNKLSKVLKVSTDSFNDNPETTHKMVIEKLKEVGL